MKKIGILYGAENSFPNAIINKINSSKNNIKGESVSVNALKLNDSTFYDVIYDRISHKIYFYKCFLKQATLNGTIVINNPFLNIDDSTYMQNLLAAKNGNRTLKSVLLPSKELPDNAGADSFVNLNFPLDWDSVFEYIGFPAIIKPNNNFSLSHKYKVYNPSDFFSAYNQTGKNCMTLVENIDFDAYYKCFVIDGIDSAVMVFDPLNPIHLRYNKSSLLRDDILSTEIKRIALNINKLFGYSINAPEFGLKDDKIYLTVFHDPATYIEKDYLDKSSFDWVTGKISQYLTELAIGKTDINYNNISFIESDKSFDIC